MERWDKYFLDICNTVASNSKCLSRKIGAIIVRDKSIISTGYNGSPRGIPHCGSERFKVDADLRNTMIIIHSDRIMDKICPRRLMGFESGEGLEWCIASHAERNAIVNAARNGIKVKGAKMYMNCGIPCCECLKEIINVGIEEIICTNLEYYDRMTSFLLQNSGIKFRRFE